MPNPNNACVHFLKWALPQMNFRWEGFRKVRGQVCSRVYNRIKELGMEDYQSYKHYLESHQDEWKVLDQFTHITISRFFRDYAAWQVLEDSLLPELAQQALLHNRPFRVWSAGCASGEEPYSFAILWKEKIAPLFPNLSLELIATDADEDMLRRADKACYFKGSLKEVKPEWLEEAFQVNGSAYCLQEEYKSLVHFQKQDIREQMPKGAFDVVFCKNLVAMYFSKELTIELFNKISNKMHNNALLILGNHEVFPLEEVGSIKMMDKGKNIYWKQQD